MLVLQVFMKKLETFVNYCPLLLIFVKSHNTKQSNRKKMLQNFLIITLIVFMAHHGFKGSDTVFLQNLL